MTVIQERCYVAGEFVNTGQYFDVSNPYTGDVIAKCPMADDDLLERAMVAAQDAFKPFASLHRDERADMLRKISDGIAARSEDFARMIMSEGGKPISLARDEVGRSIFVSRYAAEQAIRFGGEWLPADINPGGRDYTTLVRRVPLGPTLAVSPFNFPLNLIMHKLAPAIAVGCPTIIKPSSDTPLTALMLAQVCHDAGLPPGAVQVVPCRGSSFEKLIKDDRAKMLSFTGSDIVGWRLKEIAGRKRVALELGGNAAVVVHEDADLNFALARIVLGGYAHAGQICISIQRVFVHEPIYDGFIMMLAEGSKSIKSGDPSDPQVFCGPMIKPSEIDRVQAWIKEAVDLGGKILLEGKVMDGNVLTPTLIADVPREAKAYSGEIFGPVMIVNKYKTYDEALDLVNDSRYGLQASVFTNNVGRIKQAFDELEVGAIIINDIPTMRIDNYPYGGVKDSGQGREGVTCTMHEMTEERVLVIRV